MFSELEMDMRKNKNFIKFSILFWVVILLIYVFYYIWGGSLIADIYFERSFSFLNRIFDGRDTHLIEFYHAKADKFVLKIFLLIFLVYVLYVLLTYGLEFLITSGLIKGEVKQDAKLFAFLYFVLSICFLFVAGEEISWGQRLLNIETPDILMKHNKQGEITLHNLYNVPLHLSYILVALYGVCSRNLVTKGLAQRCSLFVNLISPSNFLILYFLPALVFYMYYEYLSPFMIEWIGAQARVAHLQSDNLLWAKDQEPIELLLGIGFMLFVTINWYRINIKKTLTNIISRNSKLIYDVFLDYNKKLIFIFPFFFIGILIYMKFVFTYIYVNVFINEDGIIEYLTSLVYFIAFCFSLLLSINFYKEKNIFAEAETICN